MFTDNDELSGLIASMMDAQALVILSNIDGIFTGPPNDPASRIIPVVELGRDLTEYIQTEKSGFGRGGMITKTNIARKVADEGITVFIANGKRDNILVNLMHDPEGTLCTRFEPNREALGSVKKWIAHSDGFAKGEIHLNERAVEVLTGEQTVSLLPVGVTRIEGDFEKDDIVCLMDHSGCRIGDGRVAYDAVEARNVIGKHGQRPLIHCDYLYLENL